MARITQIKDEMLKILLIEDNPADARLIKELLKDEARGSYHLEQADRLLIGLERLASDSFDVVFLDLGLPDSKGLDTLKAVTKKAAHLPVIVVTGLDDETTAIAAMRNGAQDYLLKGRIDSRVLWRVLNYAIERKQAEEALRESEEQYRMLVENINDVLYILDTQGNITYISPAIERFTKYKVNDLIRKPFAPLIHTDDLPGLLDSFNRLASGLMEPWEFRVLDKDGRSIFVRSSSRPLYKDGRIVGFTALMTDITERKIVENALKESEETFKAIVETMPLAIYLSVGVQQISEYISPTMVKLFGYTLEDIPTVADWWPLAYPDETYRRQISEAWTIKIQRAIETQSSIEPMETVVTCKDGSKKNISWGYITMGDKNYAFGLDLTERKLSEEKLLESYASLKKTLNDAINTMVKIVETRDPYTAGHQQKVADLATAIARELMLEDARIDSLRTASVIHDIGKMYIPSDILSRPGKLTDMEFNLIKAHAQAGYDIVKDMDFPGVVAKTVLQHHERLDGSGYPNGLKSKDTLLEAKILAVADVVEAMASHRPYRPALGIDKALEEISKNKGRLYDPDVADTCLELFSSGKFEFKTV